MNMRNRLLAGVAAVCLACASGCGGGPTDEEAIKESVAGWYEGLGAADGEAACSHLTDSAAEAMAGGLSGGLPSVDDSSCESTVEGVGALAMEAGVTPGGEVTSVEVDGETGTAYLDAEGTQVEMVKEDGTWLMNSEFVQK